VVGAQAASTNAPGDADVVASSGMWPRDRIADLVPSLTTDDARLFYMIRDSIVEDAPLAHLSAAEVRALIVRYSPLGAALARNEWDRAVSDVALQEARAAAAAAAAAREAATLDGAARESATRSRAATSERSSPTGEAALRETAPSLPPSEPQSEPSVARRPGSRAAPATTSVSESKTARAIPTCAAYPSLSPSPTPSSAAATATIPTKGASASATSARRGLARFDGMFVGIFGFLIVVGLAVGSARRR
jgi:cobalamin biosynthesis Mg chelatase CobN